MPLISGIVKNRITDLFEKKEKNVLSIYFTAGYPKLNDTKAIIAAVEKAGGDMIELGIPFSDPLADGPTIQESGQKALENGMSLKVLFEQLKGIRDQTDLPLLLMGYVNPIFQFGVEAFCEKCKDVGVDGVIIPDLPMEEWLSDYKEVFEKYCLKNIFLITPQTSEKRIRYIDENSDGFIYVVSSASTTGGKKDIQESKQYFKRIQEMNLTSPCLIGFNIHNKESFDFAAANANGGIIGSAFIKALSKSDDPILGAENFVKSILT